MITSSNGNIFHVTGHLCREFTSTQWIPCTRPVTRSFDVFFYLCLNKLLSKQSWGWWFEMLSFPLWRHRNEHRGTHRGRVTHICVSKLTIIGSDNVMSPGQCQAIIWNNVRILLIGPSRTNSSEILITIHTFSFKEMYLKMLSGKWGPSCLSLNVLIYTGEICIMSDITVTFVVLFAHLILSADEK